MIHSYPKVYNLGHRNLAELFDGPVVVQEKYDGSQISWAWIQDKDYDVELFVKSKGKLQAGGGAAPDKMFSGAVDYLLSLGTVTANYVFRGEWFNSPHHNTLTYDDVPPNGLILYDVEFSESNFAGPGAVREYAEALGIGAARTMMLWESGHPAQRDLDLWLEEKSTLGGPLVEGVVFKNYAKHDPQQPDKALMGKYVSPVFREKHGKAWKATNPGSNDVVANIVEQLNTEARWEKAVQHLRDDGLLEGSPRDIGALMSEVKVDTLEEEKEWITEQLRRVFVPKIARGLGRGLPEWYKARLLEEAMKDNEGLTPPEEFIQAEADESLPGNPPIGTWGE